MKRKIVELSGIPKDVILGVPIVTLMGNEEIIINNYRGVLEYTDLLTRIQTKIGQITIRGKELYIEYYSLDEMKITGKINKIEFEE